MMRRGICLLALLMMIAGCGKKTEVSALKSPAPMETLSIPTLDHRRVQELFVVVFEKDFAAEEWKQIFELTQTLSANKKLLRSIEGEDNETAGILRSKLIGENAEILTELGGKSLFMMSWSAQDENCKFVIKEDCRLLCKPRTTENPMNGGLPVAIDPVTWVVPHPARSEIKSPHLKIRLAKAVTQDSPVHYELDLKLKPERKSESETWFKGEAVPKVGSVFQKSDGTLSSQFFQYGYAELTLGL